MRRHGLLFSILIITSMAVVLTGALVEWDPADGFSLRQPHARADAPDRPAEDGTWLGLDGYCPVTLVEHQRWQPGAADCTATYEGRQYRFAGPECRTAFLASPARFAPVAAGSDVVLAQDRGVRQPGQRALGVFYRNRVYLFASRESMRRFWNHPQRYATVSVTLAQGKAPAVPIDDPRPAEAIQ